MGEKYVSKVLEKLEISWTEHLEKNLEKLFNEAFKKHERSLLPVFKKRRVELRNQRTQLRNRKEAIEGQNYESNMTLFEYSNISLIQETTFIAPQSTLEEEIVFFYLETGGFHIAKHGIIQICMISEKFELNVHVTPTKEIHPSASKIHGITKIHNKLYKDGRELKTISLQKALRQMLECF